MVVLYCIKRHKCSLRCGVGDMEQVVSRGIYSGARIGVEAGAIARRLDLLTSTPGDRAEGRVCASQLSRLAQKVPQVPGYSWTGADVSRVLHSFAKGRFDDGPTLLRALREYVRRCVPHMDPNELSGTLWGIVALRGVDWKEECRTAGQLLAAHPAIRMRQAVLGMWALEEARVSDTALTERLAGAVHKAVANGVRDERVEHTASIVLTALRRARGSAPTILGLVEALGPRVVHRVGAAGESELACIHLARIAAAYARCPDTPCRDAVLSACAAAAPRLAECTTFNLARLAAAVAAAAAEGGERSLHGVRHALETLRQRQDHTPLSVSR
eukprot:Hpha_TRINITY_DN15954_c1_g10::TRINITY_DN15954_c1_g10_i1::g.75593::m.75593